LGAGGNASDLIEVFGLGLFGGVEEFAGEGG